jgi:hypothetical protein
LRQGDYKLVSAREDDNRWELFHLAADRGEQHDLADANPTASAAWPHAGSNCRTNSHATPVRSEFSRIRLRATSKTPVRDAWWWSAKDRQNNNCRIWFAGTQQQRGRESFSGNDAPHGRRFLRKRLPTPSVKLDTNLFAGPNYVTRVIACNQKPRSQIRNPKFQVVIGILAKEEAVLGRLFIALYSLSP